MTLDDVREAKQALEAAGEVASANKILTRLQRGSKRTVLRYMRELAEAPADPVPLAPGPDDEDEAAADPVPPAPGPDDEDEAAADPVPPAPGPDDEDEAATPEQALAAAFERLATARKALIVATLEWSAAQGVRIDTAGGSRLYGRLYQTDPGYLELRDVVIEAERRYHQIWSEDIPQAEHAIKQAEQARLKADSEAWKRREYPDLVARLTELSQVKPTGDRVDGAYDRAHAEHRQLRDRLEQLWTEHQHTTAS